MTSPTRSCPSYGPDPARIIPLGEFAASFCGSHSVGFFTGFPSNGPGGTLRWLKKSPCSTPHMTFDEGSQSPWLSLTQMSPPGPKVIPCGVRRPPAMWSTCPVALSTEISVPRLSAGCGLVLAPPRLIDTERFR